MKTNKISKVFKITSIIMMIVSAALMCVVILQILQGNLSIFEASKVTYYSEDAAAVAHVRNFNMIQELSLLAGLGMMFAAGLLGAKHADRPEKSGQCALLAAASIVCLVGSFVFYSTAYSSLYNMYDIYPSSGVSIMIAILLAPTAYIAEALINKRTLKKKCFIDGAIVWEESK